MPCFQLRLWASHFPIDHVQQELLGNRFGHASMPFFRAQPSHEMSSATTSPSFSVSLLRSSSPRVSSFRTLEICADETENSSMVDEALAMMNIGEDIKERLRRERIGMANRGRVPWNKGKRHTPETRERIRQRTREALNDPKAREKRMAKQPRSHSDQVRSKISSSQRRVWAKRLMRKRSRAKFCNSWSQSIAEAARTGCSGQKELQWDSYEIIREELTQIQIELAVEREKEKEFARIRRESNPRAFSPRVRRAERNGISPEEKMRQKEEIAKAKTKARQERQELRRREKLKERLSLIRQKILVQRQVPSCPEERVTSSSQSPAWENLDIEVIKRESAQREVSLADQIMAAKKKREELAASLTVPSIRP